MTTPVAGPQSKIIEYQLCDSAGYMISRAGVMLSNMVTYRTMIELGITGQQGRVLLLVASGKCLLAAELAREFGIDTGSVTRLIDRLEERGLLIRMRAPEDRRVVRLILMPEGRAIAARMPTILNNVLDCLVSGLTPEELGSLKSMLRRIVVNSGR